VGATQRGGVAAAVEAQAADSVPQRAEANSSYQPVVTAGTAEAAPASVGGKTLIPAAQPAALAGMQVNTNSVTVVRGSSPTGTPDSQPAESAGEIYAPAAGTGSRTESARSGATALVGGGAAGGGSGSGGDPSTDGRYEFSGNGSVPRDPNREYSGPVLPSGSGAEWNPATDGEPSRQPTDRGFQRTEGAPTDDFDLDELNEVFRPDPARQR
jgi:hypothetical protein